MVRESGSPRRSNRSDNPDRDSRGPRYRNDPESSRRRQEEPDRRRYDGRDRERVSGRHEERRDGGSRGGSHRDQRGDEGRRREYRERDKSPARRRRSRDRDGSSRRSASPPQHRSRSAARSNGSRSPSPEDKAKPNFGHSGLLAAATKTVDHADGTKTVLKYHEPPEARKPSVGWRLYVFKGKEQVDLLHICRQSAYLFGRDRLVADIAVDHPSCSKQHAVIQFRQVHEANEFGDKKAVVKPFIIDLESTNGTHVNDEAIPAARYYELKLGDVVKFGESAREYVLLSEDAA